MKPKALLTKQSIRFRLTMPRRFAKFKKLTNREYRTANISGHEYVKPKDFS